MSRLHYFSQFLNNRAQNDVSSSRIILLKVDVNRLRDSSEPWFIYETNTKRSFRRKTRLVGII